MKTVKLKKSKSVRSLCDKFQHVGHLGRGGFSSVNLIKAENSNVHFAAKCQRSSSLQDRSIARAEVEILRKCQQCPYIVQLVEFFEEVTSACGVDSCRRPSCGVLHGSIIVTELLSGGDLWDMMVYKGGKIPEMKCMVIMVQVLEALKYINAIEVVHLDVKLNNIMFTTRDPNNLHVKLIDFGLAIALKHADTIPCRGRGTPDFRSPEVSEHGHAVPASDLYSAGVVLYMLLSGGMVPRWGAAQEREEMVSTHLQASTRGARLFISQLLETDYNQRPSAEESLWGQWLTPSREMMRMGMMFRKDSVMVKRFKARKRWKKLINCVRLSSYWYISKGKIQ